jgi:glycosyltransferase involved in cell wall biosynthesis
MYIAFRKFHPYMPLVIIDNSDPGDPTQLYLNDICSRETLVYRMNKNIGHAKGLNLGISKSKTPYVLIMDSDSEIIKSPVLGMAEMMDKDTYGVGWVTEIGRDGYDFGTWPHHKEPIKYLHPYFCLINLNWFMKFPPFAHHGAPFYKAAVALHDTKQSWRIRQLPGLTGHTSGIGANWKGTPSKYVNHPFGGTRAVLKSMGRKEIEGRWEF